MKNNDKRYLTNHPLASYPSVTAMEKFNLAHTLSIWRMGWHSFTFPYNRLWHTTHIRPQHHYCNQIKRLKRCVMTHFGDEDDVANRINFGHSHMKAANSGNSEFHTRTRVNRNNITYRIIEHLMTCDRCRSHCFQLNIRTGMVNNLIFISFIRRSKNNDQMKTKTDNFVQF